MVSVRSSNEDKEESFFKGERGFFFLFESFIVIFFWGGVFFRWEVVFSLLFLDVVEFSLLRGKFEKKIMSYREVRKESSCFC